MRSNRASGNNCPAVGLISDTHGLLRPEAFEALRGSELIVHAGDVGNPAILDTLRTVAPVIAVRGNIDKGEWALALPMTAAAEIRGIAIYVLHELAALDLDPGAAGFRIVVSGHTHQPGSFERRGVLYINPGSAGPHRFKLPVTVARLDLGRTPWTVDFVDLTKSNP